MKCRFCAWLHKRLCRECVQLEAGLWDRSAKWERDASNEWDLWSADSEANRDLVDRALAIEESEPGESLRLLQLAADAGSAWAMELAGRCYEHGFGAPEDDDRALDYYHRAIDAGSWMATLHAARLLERRGDRDAATAMLEQGVEADFIPALFWLARYRAGWAPSRRTYDEVRPLLERAAAEGHPGAQLTLARWMGRGRFGLSQIAEGHRRFRSLIIGAGGAAETGASNPPGLRSTV